jgi:thymidylate synthase (FAD)
MITLIRPYFKIIEPAPLPFAIELYTKIEQIGRVCYKSEDKITPETAVPFVQNLIRRGHESVLEHFVFTVRFVVNRGFTHELVRHRIAAYSQESTRYCNYGKKGLTFIIPPWLDILEGEYTEMDSKWSMGTIIWAESLFDASRNYNRLLSVWTPQQARDVLPNALKAEIITTMNIRQWRHVLNERTAPNVHPHMDEMMKPLLTQFKLLYPVLFNDVGE